MSRQQISLASELLRKYLGPCADRVAICLLRNGPLDLKGLKYRTHYPVNSIKRCLRVLISHHLVTYTVEKLLTRYMAHVGHILRMLRYSRIIHSAKCRFGQIGEAIITHLIICGLASMSSIIINVAAIITDDASSKVSQIKSIFKKLAKDSLIMKCSAIDDSDHNNEVVINPDDEANAVPELDAGQLIRKITNPSEKCTFSDVGIFWRINFYGFYIDFRDKTILFAVEQNNSSVTVNVMKAALKLNRLQCVAWKRESSYELKQYDLIDNAKEFNLAGTDLYNGLSALHGGFSNFISPVDSATYVVNFKEIIRKIVFKTMEIEIQETLGLYCRRIFTILLMDKDQDEDSIFKKALLPQKVVREHLQKLLTHDYLEFKELAENEGHGPPKTNYIFRVNEIQAVRTMLERHYTAAAKLMSKESFENESNARHIEKQEKFTLMIENLKGCGMRPEELEELEEISHEEKLFIARLRKITRQLNIALMKIDETILTLQLFLVYEDIGIE